MAGLSIVDLVLKIKGDSRDAEDKLDKVGRKADQTAVKIRDGLAAVGKITSAVNLAFAEVRVFADTVQQAGQWVNQNIFHTGAKVEAANLRQASATSGAQAADAFVGQTLARLRNAGSIGQGLRILGDYFTKGDNPLTAVTRDSPELGRQARAQFREIAQSDPARAQAILGSLAGTRLAKYIPDFRKILDDILKAQAATQAGQAWANSLPQVNVYSSIVAGGGRGSTGRQISAATTIRDRNNGRASVTISRRGG